MWDEPDITNGVITMYTVTVTEDGESAPLGQEDVVLQTNFTRDDLEPFTSYIFEVVAVTGGGTGPSQL